MAREKICGIYKIISPSSKIYIGQSTDINRRFREYKNCCNKKQRKLYCSFQKYGVSNHCFEILHICEPQDLNGLEIYYIDLFKSFNSDSGMNLRSGGDKYQVSDDTRKRMSESGKNKIITQDHRRKMYENRIFVLTESHKKKLVESNIGRVASKETRKKQSKSAKKRGLSPKLILAIKNGIWKGKKHTEETKRKMAESMRKYLLVNPKRLGGDNHSAKPVVKMDLFGNFICHYSCIEYAAIHNNMVKIKHGIGRVCSGKRKSCGGFKWVWAKDYYANNSSEIDTHPSPCVEQNPNALPDICNLSTCQSNQTLNQPIESEVSGLLPSI